MEAHTVARGGPSRSPGDLVVFHRCNEVCKLGNGSARQSVSLKDNARSEAVKFAQLLKQTARGFRIAHTVQIGNEKLMQILAHYSNVT